MTWQDIPKTVPLIIILLGLYSLRLFTLYVYKKKNNIKGKDNFVIGVNTIYYLLFFALVAIFVMVLLKVNVREFFTSISIIAAAIAIVSKDYISNAINGMILMFNNQITINDYIQIGEHKGKIVHITLMNVQLVNDDDDLIFIPNNTVLSNEIINFTKGESHKTSIEFTTDTKFIETIEDLEIYLVENAVKKNEFAEIETFRLRIISAKNTTVKLKAECKLNTKERRQERFFKRQIINAWLHYLKAKQ